MNELERDGMRFRIDRARRGKLEKAGVLRKIEKARRAQEAGEVVRVLIPATPVTNGHCKFCGADTFTNVCPAHLDLVDGLL